MIGPECQLQNHDHQNDRQEEHPKHDQGAQKELHSPPGIFERFAIDVDTTPDMPSDIGFRPEAVNAQGHHEEQGIEEGDPSQARLVDIVD